MSFDGELTIYTVVDVYRELSQIKNLGQKNLTLDLSATTQLDGAGLQLLLYLKKILAENREISINAVHPQIQPLFQLLHLRWENLTGAAKKPQQAKILESTVKLAADLDLLTVAEGVETREDFTLLRDFGVDQIQGYYFARPMAADKLIDWMNTDLKALRSQLAN
jgi:anti-anti-sigma regulatory factor